MPVGIYDRPSAASKLESRTNKYGPTAVNGLGRCWVYTGAPDGPQGYARIRTGSGERIGVHVLSYLIWNGPIREGQDVHHRCENPRCVRPTHLAALSRVEHIRISNGPAGKNSRKKVCIHGHRLSGPNLYRRPDGARGCRACLRDGSIRYRERQKAASKFQALIEALEKARKS